MDDEDDISPVKLNILPKASDNSEDSLSKVLDAIAKIEEELGRSSDSRTIKKLNIELRQNRAMAELLR